MTNTMVGVINGTADKRGMETAVYGEIDSR